MTGHLKPRPSQYIFFFFFWQGGAATIFGENKRASESLANHLSHVVLLIRQKELRASQPPTALGHLGVARVQLSAKKCI